MFTDRIKRYWRGLLVAAGCALLVACSDSSAPKEIGVSRTAAERDRNAQNQLSDAQRLGFAAPQSRPGPAAGKAGNNFNWEAQPGWKELPATPLRLANFQPGADPAAECYFSVLGGTGGGLPANVNRWRKQFDLAPLADAEIAALPRKKLLGADATYVELRGTFSGMGDQPPMENFMLLGLIGIENEQAVFVKLTAPQALAEAQLENFDRFCASLKRVEGAAPGMIAAGEGGDPQAGMPMDAIHNPHPMAGADESIETRLHWSAPAGWTQAPAKMMRVVTLMAGPAECYVSVLRNDGGGVHANFNRWREQMGQSALSAAELDALEKITVLERDSPLIEIHGDFTGMSSGTLNDYTLFGVICLLETESVFIKMTGPRAAMANEKENFVAFCKSLH